jgi:hypothetical protein
MAARFSAQGGAVGHGAAQAQRCAFLARAQSDGKVPFEAEVYVL